MIIVKLIIQHNLRVCKYDKQIAFNERESRGGGGGGAYFLSPALLFNLSILTHTHAKECLILVHNLPHHSLLLYQDIRANCNPEALNEGGWCWFENSHQIQLFFSFPNLEYFKSGCLMVVCARSRGLTNNSKDQEMRLIITRYRGV